jgi:phosphoribosylformylglycinamidine synthase
MAPWEIYISESQERMLLLVPEKNLREVLEIFENEDVEATPIGRFTKDGMLKISYNGYKVAEIEIEFLFKPPKAQRTAKWKAPSYKEPEFPEPEELTKDLLEVLSSPNVASKESVIRTYDHEVKGNTVLKPLQERYSDFLRHESQLWKNRPLLDGCFQHRRSYQKQHGGWRQKNRVARQLHMG